MYASELKMQGDQEQLVKNPIRSFCKSLVRRIHPRYASTPPDQDDTATASAPVETCQPVPRRGQIASSNKGHLSGAHSLLSRTAQ